MYQTRKSTKWGIYRLSLMPVFCAARVNVRKLGDPGSTFLARLDTIRNLRNNRGSLRIDDSHSWSISLLRKTQKTRQTCVLIDRYAVENYGAPNLRIDSLIPSTRFRIGTGFNWIQRWYQLLKSQVILEPISFLTFL